MILDLRPGILCTRDSQIFLGRLNVTTKGLILSSLFKIRQIMKLRFTPEFDKVPIVCPMETPILNCTQNSATRFIGVRAITIFAFRGQLIDIGKTAAHSFPSSQNAEFTHSRVVYQHGTIIQQYEFATHRRVSPLSCTTYRFGLKYVTANQPVDQCTLANPR